MGPRCSWYLVPVPPLRLVNGRKWTPAEGPGEGRLLTLSCRQLTEFGVRGAGVLYARAVVWGAGCGRRAPRRV